MAFNEFEQVDSALANGRFRREESLRDILDHMTYPTLEKVYENRHRYPANVHYLLEPCDFCEKPRNMKMQVVDMTDRDAYAFQQQLIDDMKARFEIYWKGMEDTISDRPFDELDDELDEAWDKLVEARERMTEYLGSKKKAYVPPSMRGKTQVDPQEAKLEREVDECKKRFEELEKRNIQADEQYLANKKDEHYQTWLRTM